VITTPLKTTDFFFGGFQGGFLLFNVVILRPDILIKIFKRFYCILKCYGNYKSKMIFKKIKNKKMENQSTTFKLSGISLTYLLIYLLTLFLLVRLLTGVGNATNSDKTVKSKTELFRN
jgi:hypothetical protein